MHLVQALFRVGENIMWKYYPTPPSRFCLYEVLQLSFFWKGSKRCMNKKLESCVHLQLFKHLLICNTVNVFSYKHLSFNVLNMFHSSSGQGLRWDSLFQGFKHPNEQPIASHLLQAVGMSSIRPGERRAGCGFAHSGPVKVGFKYAAALTLCKLMQSIL